MTISCVIPCKPYGQAKTRLAACLTLSQRMQLVKWLLLRAIHLVRPLVSEVVVVSRDRALLADARAAGALVLIEEGMGLNRALAQAAESVRAGGRAGMLVLPADLPLLTTADVAALLDLGGTPPAVVVAPCHRGTGTNALLTTPPDVIPFAFGQDSYARHLALAAANGIQPVVYHSPTIAFDLDTPEDWQTVRELIPTLGANARAGTCTTAE
jgi:2-phospho-L-lactate guanylyltransferase